MLLSFCASLLILIPVGSLQAQVSKADKKFWKQKAKMYVKNPISLKAEFENYQEQIKDLKRRNKELMNEASQSQNSDLVDSLRWALIQSEGELEALRTQNEKLKKYSQTQKTVNDMGIRTGLVYRIQIGAYVFYEIENKNITSDDFIAERADGFNKYVIGGFRDYDEATGFRDEIRKMGLEDAWVVPYLDGVRITIEEANQHLQNQGQQANFLD